MKRRIASIKNRLSHVALPIVSIFVSFIATGCATDRIHTTVRVKDYGSQIATRFRYRLFNRPDLEPVFEKLQPNVFSKNGIPCKLNDDGVLFGKMEVGYGPDINPLSYLACYFSFGVLPAIASHNVNKYAVIESVGGERVSRRVDMDFDYRMALTIISPLGLIYLDDNESVPTGNGYRMIKTSGTTSSLIRDACNDNIRESMAYGVVSRLKEMEDSGVIDVNFVKRVDEKAATERRRRAKIVAEAVGKERRDRIVSELRTREAIAEKKMARAQERTQRKMQSPLSGNASKSPYRIITLGRDGDSDFAYAFAIELNGEPSIQTFFDIQGVFRQELLNAYRIEHPKVDASMLRVVVKPQLDNGLIKGRA